MKFCRNKDCNQINPQSLNNFYIKRDSKDGLMPRCKKCHLQKCKEWTKRNPEKARITRSHWAKNNRERIYLNKKIRDSRPGAHEARKKYNRLWKINNAHRYKNTTLKRNYNITLEEYNELLKKQNNCCSICKNKETEVNERSGKSKDLSVDHCHKTKKVRGLLCKSCNKALGLFKDSIDILQSSIDYLISTK